MNKIHANNELQYHETGDPMDRQATDERELAREIFFKYGGSLKSIGSQDAVKKQRTPQVVICPVCNHKGMFIIL